MRIGVNNPNDTIRIFVKEIYNYYESNFFSLERLIDSISLDDENSDLDIFLEQDIGYDIAFNCTKIFDKMYEYDSELYKKTIGVIWTDFWLLNRFDLLEELNSDEEFDYEYSYEDMIKFKSVDDVIDYIKEYPDLLPEMIVSSIDFLSFSTFEKHTQLKCDRDTDTYLKNINSFYVFDKIMYSQLYEKDDIYYMYLKFLKENKEQFNDEDYILEYYARSYIKSFILSIRENDKYNYDLLILYMIRDSYIIEKYRTLNNLGSCNCEGLVKLIETKGINELLDKYCIGVMLDNVIYSFIEFNKLKNKDEITNEVIKAADEKTKKKLFAKN